MQIIRDPDGLNSALAEFEGETVALVPTMGALHAGHMALVEEARRHADRVVATIFVNPKQFGPNEDLARYPKREAEDAAMLEAAGCDLLWMPGVEDIYPPGFATKISVSGVSDRWEGEARPGHFDGVATVVAKLLLETFPDVALFGEKDFQQLAVIRRLVADLNIPTEIVSVATVREEDGLALSSRNAYLSPTERQQATALYRALCDAGDLLRGGRSPEAVLAEGKSALLDAGFSRVDYFALVDGATLEPVTVAESGTRLIGAAVIGGTRLIDNLAI
ncbi:MAG TPA: pantoate--beta-alanine ligase [Sphingomicrobium sp.]